MESLSNKFFIPDGVDEAEALGRTSHLAIGAHPDDLEFMAFHGIASCYQQPNAWFGGIILGDGCGSQSDGSFGRLSASAQIEVRASEQKKAAQIGEYSFVEQLQVSSDQIREAKGEMRSKLVDQMFQRLLMTQPEILYTHNPLDSHSTHLAVMRLVVDAVRLLPPYSRPKKIYGCEMWRSLDWVPTSQRVALDVSPYPELAERLCGCFQSQIQDGKRYDRAIAGRQYANATLMDPYSVDGVDQVTYALDLTHLFEDEGVSVRVCVDAIIKAFREDSLKALDVLPSEDLENRS